MRKMSEGDISDTDYDSEGRGSTTVDIKALVRILNQLIDRLNNIEEKLTKSKEFK